MLPASALCKKIWATVLQLSHVCRVDTAPLHANSASACVKWIRAQLFEGGGMHGPWQLRSAFSLWFHAADIPSRGARKNMVLLWKQMTLQTQQKEVGAKKHPHPPPRQLCKSVPARRAPGGAHRPPPRESVRVQVLTVSSGLTFRCNTARTFVFPQQWLLQSIIIAHPRVQTHKDLIYSAKIYILNLLPLLFSDCRSISTLKRWQQITS